MAEPDATDTEQQSGAYECFNCGDRFHVATDAEIHEEVNNHHVEGL